MLSPWQHSTRTTWDYVVECNKTNMAIQQYPPYNHPVTPLVTLWVTTSVHLGEPSHTQTAQLMHKNYTSTLLNVVPTELTHHMVEWNAKPMLDWSAKQTVSHVIVMWWSCEIYYQCSPKAFSVISYNSYIIFYPLLVSISIKMAHHCRVSLSK